MKSFRRIISAVLILSLVFLAGCLTARIPEDETAEGTETKQTEGTKAPAPLSPETPALETTGGEIPTEQPTDSPTEAPTEPPTEAPTEPPVPDGMTVSFGRLAEDRIAEVNARTLETEGSGLYDVLAGNVWLQEEVLPLIEAYALPERPFYGARAVTPDLREEILKNRNVSVLSEHPGASVQLRYGIISQNASVRSFPTSMRACDSLDGRAFDYFQESMFQIGEGVLILHESLDGQWAFVRGTNYAGWVLEEEIAFASEQEFRSFLTGRGFAVVLKPAVPVSLVLPSGELYQRNLRLGTILPMKERTEQSVTLVFPVRNEAGDFSAQEITLENNGAFSAGFVPYSTDALLRIARSVEGHAYGWGDEKENYDCSSFAGLAYRCFGIYTPRNSSQFRCFGGTVTDVTGRDAAWKYTFLEQRPGAVLAYPGHVMLYEKTEGGRHYILHANSVWYDGTGALHEAYRVWEAPLEDLHRGDGSLFIDAVRWIVTFP